MPDTSTCSYHDCKRPTHCKGLCATHYQQLNRTGELSPIRDYKPRPDENVLPDSVTAALWRIKREVSDAADRIVEQLLEVRRELNIVTQVIQESDGNRIREHGERRIERAKHGTC